MTNLLRYGIIHGRKKFFDKAPGLNSTLDKKSSNYSKNVAFYVLFSFLFFFANTKLVQCIHRIVVNVIKGSCSLETLGQNKLECFLPAEFYKGQ
jgi:hypothetical protein